MPSGRKPTIHFKDMGLTERRAYNAAVALKHRRMRGVQPKISAKELHEIQCRACGVTKTTTADNFYVSKDGYLNRKCKACAIADGRTRLLLKWGLSEETYKAALLRGCVLCGGKDRLALDHCHGSNKLRNMLCARCNTGLGAFRDRPDLLRLAAQYVEHYAKVHAGTPT